VSDAAPRVLIARFSAIGDCVMSVPVAASIRRSFPEAGIVWAIEDRCVPVVDTERLVQHLHVFHRKRWKRERKSPRAWREQLLAYTSLRGRFDFGIDLQGHLKTALCLRIAAPKHRISAYATDAVGRGLSRVAEGVRGERHCVEWYLEVLSQLGPFDRSVEFPMPKFEPERAELSPRLSVRPLVTISVGAGEARKLYPIERWNEVGAALVALGYGVAFVGGPGDAAPSVEGALDLVGKLPLAQTMAAISLSRLHLAADTGSGHIAAAYGIPVVSVFGPTSAANYRPYQDGGIVLQNGPDPASVDPAEVIEAAARTLERTDHAVPR
jgi:ADP-heptose:LPS heptosyltransferase